MRNRYLAQERKEGKAPPRPSPHPEVAPGRPFAYLSGIGALMQHPYTAAGPPGEELFPVGKGDPRSPTGAPGAFSDVFFVALRLGLIAAEIVGDDAGPVLEFTEDGVLLPPPPPEDSGGGSSSGERRRLLRADLVIKNFGFDPDAPSRTMERITGRRSLVEPIWVSPRISYHATERNQALTGAAGTPLNVWGAPELLNITLGMTNMADYLAEVFLHFAQRAPEELPAFLGEETAGGGGAAAGAEAAFRAAEREPAPRVDFAEDSMVGMCQGIFAAMRWSPEVHARTQAIRADVNRRLSARYSPLRFLEENERDWKENCRQLAGGDPDAVPFMWGELLEKLRTEPTLLDHLFPRSHKGEAPAPRVPSGGGAPSSSRL